MATYKELKAQMAELEEQVATARAAEFLAVLADVRAKVADYGLTERDIFGRGRVMSRRSIGPAKYCDPKTGATWSGNGRAPSWIRNAKDRDMFLIRD